MIAIEGLELSSLRDEHRIVETGSGAPEVGPGSGGASRGEVGARGSEEPDGPSSVVRRQLCRPCEHRR